METKVVLFADDETSKRYGSTLATVGVNITSIKPLSCEQILTGVKQLISALETNSYDALVITSSKASNILSNILKENPNIQLPQKIYTVGSITAKSLPDSLSSKCVGLDTGNAASLADLIISEAPDSVLFPCGDLALDVLPKKLEGAGIKLHRIEVYATRQNSELENILTKMTINEELPPTMIFFSPSGVDYVYEILKKLNFDFESARLIAIGPSTEARIKAHNLKVWATAKKPTPENIAAIFIEK